MLLLAWLFYTDRQNIVSLSVMACILHELGHIFAIRCLGSHVKEISITIVGAEIKTERLLDYRSEGIVALCGPCVNFLLAMLFGIPEWGHVFAGINLALGSLNLLPVHPLDGGRMLRAALAYLIDASWADQVSECLGLVFSVLLCLFGGWITLCSGNITLLLVSAWMTSTYFKRKVCD